MLATQAGATTIVQLLAKHGADVNRDTVVQELAHYIVRRENMPHVHTV